MTKGIVALIVLVGFVVVGWGRIDDLRGNLSGLDLNVFSAVPGVTVNPQVDQGARTKAAASANAICAAGAARDLKLYASVPRSRKLYANKQYARRQYVRLVGISIKRQRELLAKLRALQGLPGFEAGYAHFLADRANVIAAMAKMRHAVATNDRNEAISAARLAILVQPSINSYTQSVGMPACAV